jgi:hypothetical protein
MKIQLTDTVYKYHDKQCDVTVSVDDEHISAYVDYGLAEANHNVTYNIHMDPSVEYLAELFAFEKVCVFKTVVELLGKANALKDTL